MKSRKFLVFCSIPLVFLASQSLLCQTFRNIQRGIVVDRALRLSSFEGDLTETGTLPKGTLEYKIFFKRPGFLRSEIVAPASHRGILSVYADNTLYSYFPSTKFGYVYANIPPQSPAEEQRLMLWNFDRAFEIYEPRIGNRFNIAGHSGTEVSYPARRQRRFVFNARAYIHEPFSFPLKSQLLVRGGPVYDATYSRVVFNRNIPDETFQFKFPEGTTVARYDLGGPSVTAADLQAALPRGKAPAALWNIPLTKIVRVDGVVPGFALLYRKSPFTITFSMVKDFGIELIPPRGMRVSGKRPYLVNFFGTSALVYFLADDVHYLLAGNVPYEELLTVAEQL